LISRPVKDTAMDGKYIQTATNLLASHVNDYINVKTQIQHEAKPIATYLCMPQDMLKVLHFTYIHTYKFRYWYIL